MPKKRYGKTFSSPNQKVYPPKRHKTIKFKRFQRMMARNSPDMPEYVNIGGARKWWTGIGLVSKGPAHGDEVIITEEDGSLPVLKATRDGEVDFWARCQFYEPFTMGGEVWQWVRYPMVGNVRVACGHQCFVAKTGETYHVYEATTGGSICEAETKKKAMEKARSLIKKTPDFQEQIDSMESIFGLRIVTAEEALDRLEHTKKAKENAA